MNRNFQKVFILLSLAGWMVTAGPMTDAIAQSSADACAAANEDLPGQYAQAKDLLREKHPPPPDPADFDDGCWNDPQAAATRDQIVNAWVEDLKKPEWPIVQAIIPDVHVLDTFKCWNNDVGEQNAIDMYTKLAQRIENKLVDFIQTCAKKKGFGKYAYEAGKANQAFHDVYLITPDNGEAVLKALGPLYSRWIEDIDNQVYRDHNFALLQTFGYAAKVYQLLSDEDQTSMINSFADHTRCEVNIDYTFNIKNNTGKFEYHLTGKQKIKFMPIINKWVPIDFQFGGGAPNPATITMTYEEGRIYTDKGKAELKKTESVTNNGKNVTQTGMSFDTPIGLSVTPCPSAQNQLEFKIQDLGAQKETWVAHDGNQDHEYNMPMTLLGFSNTFMADYTDSSATNFVFHPTTFQNKQAQLVDETFKSNLIPDIQDICQFHLTITQK